MSVFGVFLVGIFPHLGLIWRDTEYPGPLLTSKMKNVAVILNYCYKALYLKFLATSLSPELPIRTQYFIEHFYCMETWVQKYFLPLRSHCVNYARILTYILPFKDRIVDTVLTQENTGQRKLVFWHVLHSGCFEKFYDGFHETMTMFVSMQGDVGNLWCRCFHCIEGKEE